MRLESSIKRLTLAALLSASPVAVAVPYAVEPHWAGFQLGLADVDVPGGDLDVAEAYSLELGRWFNNNFGVEMGLSALRDAKEEGSDNRGTYQVNVESDETFVGARLSTSHYDTVRFFASGGLIYSRVNVEVEEQFYGLKPGGKNSDRSDATGYYVSGGMSVALPGRIDLNGVIRYRNRPDAISTYGGDIDVEDASLMLGAAFRF